eukprot:scaffold46229_cov30-Attheya_sp.AAC.1
MSINIQKLVAVLASLVTCHVTSSSLDVECRDCREAALNVSLNHSADTWKDFGIQIQDFMEDFGCDERKRNIRYQTRRHG